MEDVLNYNLLTIHKQYIVRVIWSVIKSSGPIDPFKHLLNSNDQTDYKMRFRYDDTTNKLREIYEDKDGERKKEVQALSGPNEFTEFYNRYKVYYLI